MAVSEKDIADYPESQDGAMKVLTGNRQRNWRSYFQALQHVKEIITLSVVVWIAFTLTGFLGELVKKATALMERAAGGGPVAIEIVSKIDWHLLGLAISLVTGLSVISVMLLRSVFGIQDSKTSDGLSLSDVPAATTVMDGIRSVVGTGKK